MASSSDSPYIFFALLSATQLLITSTCGNIWPLQICFLDSEEHKKMASVVENDSSLAMKCLDICQALTSQGKIFNFSLSIGPMFSFSFDSRDKTLDTRVGPTQEEEAKPLYPEEERHA